MEKSKLKREKLAELKSILVKIAKVAEEIQLLWCDMRLFERRFEEDTVPLTEKYDKMRTLYATKIQYFRELNAQCEVIKGEFIQAHEEELKNKQNYKL